MNPKTIELEALKRAVELAGGQTAFAKKLGTTQGNVWGWLNLLHHIPAKHVLNAERSTGVSRHELRPDIYPLEERGLRDTQ